MSSKPAVLFQAVAVPAAETTVYTSPDKLLTIITKLSACNTNVAAVQVTAKIIASGGSASTDEILTQTRTMFPGESYGFPELIGQHLNPGDFISILPSDTGVNMRGSGTQVAV